jgi:hypothetical protein
VGALGQETFFSNWKLLQRAEKAHLVTLNFFLFFKMKQEGRSPTVLLLKRIKRTVQYLQVTANTAMPSETYIVGINL